MEKVKLHNSCKLITIFSHNAIPSRSIVPNMDFRVGAACFLLILKNCCDLKIGFSCSMAPNCLRFFLLLKGLVLPLLRHTGKLIPGCKMLLPSCLVIRRKHGHLVDDQKGKENLKDWRGAIRCKVKKSHVRCKTSIRWLSRSDVSFTSKENISYFTGSWIEKRLLPIRIQERIWLLELLCSDSRVSSCLCMFVLHLDTFAF